MPEPKLDDQQYQQLLEFRVSLRRFLQWSEEEAASAGLTTQQHQVLLAIRGHKGPGRPTIGDVANSLLLRHNSVVELINRTEQAGFVARNFDDVDRRVVRLELTTRGKRVLDWLSVTHLEELARLAPIIGRLSAGLDRPDAPV